MKKLLFTMLLLMFSSYSFSEQESVTVPTQGLSTISPTLTEPIEIPSCLKQGKENLQGFERSKKLSICQMKNFQDHAVFGHVNSVAMLHVLGVS
ncbi:hypothetical protein [Aliivibrio fischeri]|uniref:hypothetical protein n=1 Tax=Aliivibrio fischeri TaxID=668 RepID=UPI001F220264|nr:hypothetical protein [Aliivibrio fischeri]